MGRLTKHNASACQYCKAWGDCLGEEPCFLYEVYEKLAHYEDLEEQGRLIEVIRCKDCAMESTCVHTQYQGEDGYCSMAELKELEGVKE